MPRSLLKYIILLLFFSIGCNNKQNNVRILESARFGGVTINVVESIEDIKNLKKYPYSDDSIYYALAFYDPLERTIWVPKNDINDENGKVMPNLFLLGHEIWHVIEPGYHSKTNSDYSIPNLPGFKLEYSLY